MAGELQPLDQKFLIVDKEGRPTIYFIEWAQQRQIDITGAITAEQAQQLIEDWSTQREIIAGTALDGGGTLDADVTIDHADSTVTPDTYGDATHVAQITVDQQGHVTDVTEVAISGGGGGGGDVGFYSPGGFDGAATSGNDSATYQALIQSYASLVNYWPLDDAAGTASPVDVQSANNLTRVSAVTLGVPGRLDATCAFLPIRSTNNGDYTWSCNRQVQDDFSLELWLLAQDGRGGSSGAWYEGGYLIGRDIGGVTNDFGLVLNNFGVVIFGTGNPDTQINPAWPANHILDGAWHHIVATRLKSTGARNLYIDGALAAGPSNGNTNTLNASATLLLGGMQGFVADIATYNAVLTPTEILANYNAGRPH